MKKLIHIILINFFTLPVAAQHMFTGKVVAEESAEALVGATVRVKGVKVVAKTDAKGIFTFYDSSPEVKVSVTLTGYTPAAADLKQGTEATIIMSLNIEELEGVTVSNGYQNLPVERATGSFSIIDEKSLNLSTDPNIINRLEGMATGLVFNRAQRYHREAAPNAQLRVRGVGSIISEKEPLIVLDGFVFTGRIEDINPNDIASVNILKDAAAASIWGSQAGNGVIVITSKNGNNKKGLQVELNSNVTILSKPDLFYDRNFLNASEIMGLEEALFSRRAYRELPQIGLPAYVELLIAQRDGKINDAEFEAQKNKLLSSDIRKQAEEHLYRESIQHQHTLTLRGGDKKYSYMLSGGMNKDAETLVGNSSQRLTLNTNSVFKPTSKLEIQLGINLFSRKDKNGGLSLNSLHPSSRYISPYTQLVDENGVPQPILKSYRTTFVNAAESSNLLNWQYVPLNEVANANDKRNSDGLRLNTRLSYEVFKNLKASVMYQLQSNRYKTYTHYNKDTYYVRDLVNRFTQADGTLPIPYGEIYRSGESREISQSGRFQTEYGNTFKNGDLNLLGGMELRESVFFSEPGFTLYNYDASTVTGTTAFDYTRAYSLRPTGTGRIAPASNSLSHRTNRFLSYYLNGSYLLKNKYLFTASSRWDASNIFGVKTNQKGVPLWSAGMSWDISKEKFWNVDWVEGLKPRATLGYNGNVNNLMSTVPVVLYTTDYDTGILKALIRSTGNPNLRWEKIRTLNLGVDFSLWSGRVRGSAEYYAKTISDLIGVIETDPTTGVSKVGNYYEIDNKINYASMFTSGMDLAIHTQNIRKKLKWHSDIFISTSSNKVTKYNAGPPSTIVSFFTLNTDAPPVVGKSLDALYSIPWNGLNPETGDPLVYINGDQTTAYSAYLNQLKYEDIRNEGVTVPKITSSFRNTVSWKKLSLSFNIIWKAGHVFRRSSISYNTLLAGGQPHIDYTARWNSQEDYGKTQVPSQPAVSNLARDQVYLFSQQLIEKGDHIRLKDLNFSYEITLRQVYKLRFYSTLNNIGILWRHNKYKIDPDYPLASYPAPRSFSLGIQLSF